MHLKNPWLALLETSGSIYKFLIDPSNVSNVVLVQDTAVGKIVTGLRFGERDCYANLILFKKTFTPVFITYTLIKYSISVYISN